MPGCTTPTDISCSIGLFGVGGLVSSGCRGAIWGAIVKQYFTGFANEGSTMSCGDHSAWKHRYEVDLAEGRMMVLAHGLAKGEIERTRKYPSLAGPACPPRVQLPAHDAQGPLVLKCFWGCVRHSSQTSIPALSSGRH